MTEETSPGAGVESTTTAAVTETTETPETETPEAEGTTPESHGDAEQAEKAEAEEASEAAKKLNQRKVRSQERIQELNSKWREEQRRADRLQQRLAEIEGKVTRPDPSKYDDPQKYQADDAAAVAAQYRHEDAKAEAEAAATKAQELRAEAWAERCADFSAQATDFHEVISNPSLPITPFMAQSVQLMEDGPSVAYHLGQNPAEARRISRMEPPEALIELGKISARLSSPPPKRVTQAPQPVSKVSGSSGGPKKDPGQMSPAEFIAWRKAGGDL